jgi:hypothetical protein
MKKLGTYLLYGGALVFASALIYISLNANKQNAISKKKDDTVLAQEDSKKSAEKVQVFLFHATKRCPTCIAIGKYAKETVEQKFPAELLSGKIEFREINIDLPENKELANKFKATGSALFLNAIIDGKDNMKQDVQVWRLTSNEQNFISYLSDEIKKLL